MAVELEDKKEPESVSRREFTRRLAFSLAGVSIGARSSFGAGERFCEELPLSGCGLKDDLSSAVAIESIFDYQKAQGSFSYREAGDILKKLATILDREFQLGVEPPSEDVSAETAASPLLGELEYIEWISAAFRNREDNKICFSLHLTEDKSGRVTFDSVAFFRCGKGPKIDRSSPFLLVNDLCVLEPTAVGRAYQLEEYLVDERLQPHTFANGFVVPEVRNSTPLIVVCPDFIRGAVATDFGITRKRDQDLCIHTTVYHELAHYEFRAQYPEIFRYGTKMFDFPNEHYLDQLDEALADCFALWSVSDPMSSIMVFGNRILAVQEKYALSRRIAMRALATVVREVGFHSQSKAQDLNRFGQFFHRSIEESRQDNSNLVENEGQQALFSFSQFLLRNPEIARKLRRSFVMYGRSEITRDLTTMVRHVKEMRTKASGRADVPTG